MPITVAHPAAVLVLRRSQLPVAAMVVGSMVPDVPLFLGWGRGYALSHSLAGVVTVDLLGALVLLAGWDAFVRDALVDLSPDAVRTRLSARRRLTRREWLLAPTAAVVGSLTHLAWDAFTHPGRWGVTHLAWLRADHGPLPGFQWAQYASGVLGTGIVLLAVVTDLRSRPRTPPRRGRRLPAPALPVLLCAAGAVGLVAGLSRLDDGLHAVAFTGVVQSIVATCAGVLVACAAWALRRPVPE